MNSLQATRNEPPLMSRMKDSSDGNRFSIFLKRMSTNDVDRS